MRPFCKVLIIFFLSTGIIFAQRINIFPTTLSYNVSRGNIQNQTVYITNPTTQKQVFQLSVADWIRNDDGSHTYYPASTQPFSCASWVTLSSNIVDVDPGKTVEITVTLQGSDSPAEFDVMKWAMLFLQNVVEKGADAADNSKVNTQIREVMRIGVHIYQTPPALTRQEAKALELEPDTTESKAYWFKVQNVGKTMVYCKAYLDLTDTATGQQYRSETTDFPMFPTGNRKVRLSVPPNVPKGKYSMLAILDYSEDASLEAIEKNIEIVN